LIVVNCIIAEKEKQGKQKNEPSASLRLAAPYKAGNVSAFRPETTGFEGGGGKKINP
jgi:hypothetical protein